MSLRSGAFSRERLGRMADVMRGYVDRGEVAGVVTLLCRHDEIHVETIGRQDLAAATPMRRDTVFRIASMTKPITAAAAMILVEEAKLRLDDPVDRWLPELADRRVLRGIDRPLDDTVPAHRQITLRDLLTFRLGVGAIMELPDRYPIQKAMTEAGLAPRPDPLPFSTDEFLARLGRLPLMHQPGERWMYHTGSDVLGALIARATGMTLGDFLQERIFAPLGMKDTAFNVPESTLGRLATCYQFGTGRLAVYDEARGGRWSRPPAFQSGGGGRVNRRRLPCVRAHDAEPRPLREGAHARAPDRRAHDLRSADRGRKGGLALCPRILGQSRLGLRPVRDHPA